jgi:hypothetical protein
MRVRGRIFGVARSVAALALAVVLSGGLPLVEAAVADGEHHCQCHHRAGETCSCWRCSRAAAKARRASLDDLPPCHRAAALAALEREERQPPAGDPVVQGCCGAPERFAAAVTADPFVPPILGDLGPAAPVRARPVRPASEARDVPRAPPTPPPRLA